MKHTSAVAINLSHQVTKRWVKVVLSYIALSFVYIYTSDSFLKVITTNVYVLSGYQTAKGIGFIMLTGLVMVYLAKGNIRDTSGHYQNVLQTEQEHSNERLSMLEEKYWSLFNHIPLPMWIFDCETLRFLQVNDAAILRYGYTAEEFGKMTIKDIRPAEDLEMLNTALQSVRVKPSCTWPHSFRHLLKNGSLLHVKIESIATMFEGRPARLVLATDITDEMVTQQNLLAANKTLRSASEIANMGYWSNNLETGKIHWSEELYRIFGVDPNTFVLSLENIQTYFHPDNRTHFKDDLTTAYAQGEVREFEQQIFTPAGEKWILQRISVEKNKDGVPIMIEGITLDITSRKTYEKALKESNTRYEMVMKASGDAIIDWDTENNKAQWGASFRELFGHNMVANDETWLQYIHPEDKERVKLELKQAFANVNQLYFYTKFRFLKANAQIAYVKHKGVFVRNAEGRVIRAVGAMIDITESVRHLQFIEKQNVSLREIAWVQSHVVRGPLCTLMGLVTMLKERKQYGLNEEELIENITATANRLDDVIKVIVEKSELITTATDV